MKIKLKIYTYIALLFLFTILFFWGLRLEFNNSKYLYLGSLIVINVIFRKTISEVFFIFLEKRHFSQSQLNIEDFSQTPNGLIQKLAILTYSIILKTKEFSFIAPTTLILLFLLLFVALVFYQPALIDPSKDTFNNSVLPSLFVFTLDGLLIVGLLSYFSNRQDRLKKEQLRLILRSFLFKYIAKTASSLHLDEDIPTLLSSENATLKVFNRFIRNLHTCTQEQKDKFGLEIKKMAAGDIAQAAALLVISASLSPAHTEVWFSSINALQKIADSSESSWNHPLINLLGSILELDEINFKGEKTNLNIQQMMNLQ